MMFYYVLNISKKKNIKFKQFLKLNITRFFRHFGDAMQRIADNLDAVYHLFPVIADPVNGAVSKNSETWREQWQSLHFVSFVLCLSDIHNGFDYSSINSQKAINTAPGFQTFYLKESKKKI